MRNGKVLAEDSPQNLMTNFEVANLEDVFLKLCHMGNYYKKFDNGQNIYEGITESKCLTLDSEKAQKTYQQKLKNIKILNWKNILVYLHYPGSLFFLLIYPFILISIFHLMLGGNFGNNQIGVVSEEIENYAQDCKNAAFISGKLIGNGFNYSCNRNKLSYGFLDVLEKYSLFSIVRNLRFQQL
jgi:hypothetical protein